MVKVAKQRAPADLQSKKEGFFHYVFHHKALYLMLLPVLLYYLTFCYVPMFGVVVAFQDYIPGIPFFENEWVGLRYFEILFKSPDFPMIMRNTLSISLQRLIIGFPAPIILALMLNEVRTMFFKRTVQTISYLPFFLSWVIVGGIITELFSLDGPINGLLSLFGVEKQALLYNSGFFQPMLVMTGIWKDVGWGSILFLSALAGIDQQLYEAAVIDGAGRWKQTLHISLPGLKPIMVVLLIMNVGGILNAGFDQIFILQNEVVRSVSEIIDTYVYKVGISNSNYSFGTAVGLFKSVVGFVLVIGANWLARRMGEESLL